MPYDRSIFRPRPGYMLIKPSHTSEEMRLVAQLMEDVNHTVLRNPMDKIKPEKLSQLGRHWKHPDVDDPFWNRLCEHKVTEEAFASELLSHLGMTDHPKGSILVKLARELADDLQDAYLHALDLLDLL